MADVFRTPAGRQLVENREGDLFARWAPEARRRVIRTRCGETVVWEAGPPSAHPLMALHGTAANSAMWLHDLPMWSRSLRVVAVDITGDAGQSTPARPPLDSEAHALWLDDVLAELGIAKAHFVGVSLGGWLALDYATRRPDQVSRLVAINPAGVGREKNVLVWALPLLLLGTWGRRKMMERIAGPAPAEPTPLQADIGDLSELIFRHFRPRTASMPQFSDAALDRLTMPMLAILGGKDVFIDAPGARRRLEAHAPRLKMRYLPEGHHFVPGQTEAIAAFLTAGGSNANR